MMGYWFGPYGWIMMIVNAVIWLAVIGGLIWLGVWAVRRFGGGSSGGGPAGGQSAKEIVQLRYARGEITREQYDQMIKDLQA